MTEQQRSRDYYDTFSHIYEAERHEGYHRWLDERTVALLRRHVTGKDVLEVGCGTGLLLRDVAKNARRAVGVDLSHGMLKPSHERGLDVIQGSATSLPFADQSFDVVYSFKVLAHVPDLAMAMSEMARVLRPGGLAICEFYNKHSLRYAIRRLRPAGQIGAGTTEEDVHTRFHGASELLALMPPSLKLEKTAGLRVATVFPQVFKLPGVGPVWERLEDGLAKTPLHRLAGFLILMLRRI